MKVICKHYQNSCKKIGAVECNKYNAKANKPEQLRKQINKAYKIMDIKTAIRLSDELFRKENGC